MLAGNWRPRVPNCSCRDKGPCLGGEPPKPLYGRFPPKELQRELCGAVYCGTGAESSCCQVVVVLVVETSRCASCWGGSWWIARTVRMHRRQLELRGNRLQQRALPGQSRCQLELVAAPHAPSCVRRWRALCALAVLGIWPAVTRRCGRGRACAPCLTCLATQLARCQQLACTG